MLKFFIRTLFSINYKHIIFFIKTVFFIGIPLLILFLSLIFHNDRGYRELEYRLGAHSSSWKSITGVAENLDFIGWNKKVDYPIQENQKIELVFQKEIWEQIKAYGESRPVKKIWVQGTLIYNEDSIRIKVKLHGTDLAHYIDQKFSYTIKKINSNDSTLKGDRFKLLKGEEFFPSIIALNNIAASYDLIAPSSKMVELKVNGKVMGHYSFGPDIKNEFINKKFGHQDWTILANIDGWTRKERLNNPGHISDFDIDYTHIKNRDDASFPEALGVYKKVVELSKAKNYQALSSFFDEEYIGTFLALTYLYNDSHFLSGDNVKWIYNQKEKKLYPVFRIETEGLADRDILTTLNGREVKNNYPFLDQAVWVSRNRYKGYYKQFIFKSLLKNEAIRHVRNKVMSNFINQKQTIFSFINQFHKDNLSLMLEYGGSRRAYELRQKTQLLTLEAKFKLMKDYLKYGQVFYTYNQTFNQYEFIFDSFVRIQVCSGNKILFEKSSFDLGHNFVRDYKKIQYPLDSTEGDLYFVNSITNDTIHQVYKNTIQEYNIPK